MDLYIRRWQQEDCVVGRLKYGEFECFTLELPNLQNKIRVSCIPDGRYEAFKRFSPGKKYWVVEYKDVPGRTFIQIHKGNFTSQLLGCQAVGDSIAFVNSDSVLDVTNSGKTFEELMDVLPDKFYVNISGLKNG